MSYCCKSWQLFEPNVRNYFGLIEKTRLLLVINLIHCLRGVTFGLFPLQYMVFYIGFVIGISGVDLNG